MRTQFESDYDGTKYAVSCGANVATCTITNDSAGAPTGGTWGASGSYATLAKDAFGQNNSGLIIVATSASTAGASPVTAYAIYGKLVSDATKYFCIDSTGKTKSADTQAATVTCSN
jgi:hypothetical protein